MREEEMRVLLLAFALIVGLLSPAAAQGSLDPLGAQIDAINRMNESIRGGTYGTNENTGSQVDNTKRETVPDCASDCQNHCGSRGYDACYRQDSQCMVRCR
jgi:hypothetical protein